MKQNRVLAHLFLLPLALLTLVPVVLMLLNSVRTHERIVRNPFAIDIFRPQNFVEIWQLANYSRGILNSIWLVLLTVIVTLIAAVPTAYVIGRKKVRLWRAVSIYFLFSVTVPIQLFLFPLYFTYVQLDWLNSLPAVALILAAINLPFPIFLLSTYVMMVPIELEYAAAIDGATPFMVMCRIVVPLIQAGLITVVLLVTIAVWNDYLISSTFLQQDAVRTAGLKFLSLIGSRGNDYALLFAAAAILVLPIFIIYTFLQKYLIRGITSGSIR